IDSCDRERLVGWVFDPHHPQHPVRLEIWCDQELVGHVLADRFRNDLAAAGFLGNGCCAFALSWPVKLNPLTSHTVEIRRVADGAALLGSPLMLPAAAAFDETSRGALAHLLRGTAEQAQ